MRKLLVNYWPLIILAFVTGFAAWKNVVPGTYLTGWDNLHTEYDFTTNVFDRGIKGVWQYYQGLGVPSGNAHVADLPRQIALWAVSFIVPHSYLRYAYHLFAWFAGGAGIYILISQLLLGDRKRWRNQTAGLVGALFYLFNLGTMQNFYTPYEAFSHFFMMLPWLIYVLYRYLIQGTKKSAWYFFLFNLLAVPMAYIPTVFIVYGVCLTVLVLGTLIHTKFKVWRRALSAAALIFIVNSFWLLPFVHFVSQNTQGVVDARINRMFTREAFLRNQEYGTIDHALILEGFWFDTTDMTSTEGGHDLMMRPWVDFLNKPGVRTMLWLLSGFALLGLVVAVIRKKPVSVAITVLTLLGLFALINDNWPSGGLFRFMQEKIPLFGQVLRFPYTKFITVTVLGYAVGIAWFADLLLRRFRLVGSGAAILISALILYTQIPTLTGSFFYDKLRLTVPDEYFSLFRFFQEEDRFRGRVANLPQPTFWGWTTYSWGYRGSGFPWYGIPQPVLDRNFDVWSPESEKYYAEISHALYDQEKGDEFLSVLTKYGVDYVWVDSSVIHPQKPKLLDMTDAERWLAGGGFTLVFDEGEQKVYKRNEPVPQFGPAVKLKSADEDIFRLVDLRKYSGLTGDYWRYNDLVFDRTTMPAYLADKQDDSQIYAYRDADIKKAEFPLTELGRTYSLSDLLPDSQLDERTWWMRSLTIYYSGGPGSSVKVCLMKGGPDECYYKGSDDNEKGGERWGTFLINNTTSLRDIHIRLEGSGVRPEKISIGYFDAPATQFPLTAVPRSLSTALEIDLYKRDFPPTNCFTLGKGWIERVPRAENSETFVSYRSFDASSCESMLIGNSDVLVQGGTLSVRSRNVEGRPVKMCLRHDPPGDCLIEDILPMGNTGEWVESTFEIPPVTKMGDLYLEIDNYAVGQEVRANDVGTITLSSSSTKSLQEMNFLEGKTVYTNNQAFRAGWVGVGLDASSGYELDHVLVNGWANGWIIPAGVGRVVAVYWPQLLEYAGFVFILITSVILLRTKKRP